MQNRIPTYQGRYKMVDEIGQQRVITLERFDEATQEGNPLNKETLFSDNTAELFGMESNSYDATPDKGFRYLYNKTKWHKVIESEIPVDSPREYSLTLPSDFGKYSEAVVLVSCGYDENAENPTVPIEVSFNNVKVAELSCVRAASSEIVVFSRTSIILFVETASGKIISFDDFANKNSRVSNVTKENILNLSVNISNQQQQYYFGTNSKIIVIAR